VIVLNSAQSVSIPALGDGDGLGGYDLIIERQTTGMLWFSQAFVWELEAVLLARKKCVGVSVILAPGC
jgi:hypothetical protein